MSVVTHNEAAQRKGCVFIKYIVGDPISLLIARKEEAVKMVAVRDGCPARMVGGHVCLSRNILAHRILYYYLLLATPFVLQRLQIHSGICAQQLSA